MKPRQIVLLVLLVPAALVIVEYFKYPGEGHEVLALIFAVPVLVLNMWEWSGTPGIAALFRKKPAPAPAAQENKAEEPDLRVGPENATKMDSGGSGKQAEAGESDTRVDAESTGARMNAEGDIKKFMKVGRRFQKWLSTVLSRWNRSSRVRQPGSDEKGEKR
jgi:hypothetical protein